MDIPTDAVGVKAAVDNITAEIQRLEANIKIERAKLQALRTVCQHPESHVRRWHSNPMGRWPTNHFQCDICGLHKET